MATRIWKKQFAVDFTGINAECSAIEPEGGEVSRAVNLEWATSNNLRGRVGCQLAGIPGRFFSLFSHSYARTQSQYVPVYQGSTPYITSTLNPADGATISQLLAINTDLFVLDTLSVPITNVSANYPIKWWTAVASSNVHFYMTHNAVSLLDYNAGTGHEKADGTYKSMYDLFVAINALAELSVAITNRGVSKTPFAVVNGDQTATTVATHPLGTTYSITVDNTHNFFAGDPICFTDFSSASGGAYIYGYVTESAATTITFAMNIGNAPVVKDNQIIGTLSMPAAAFQIVSPVSETSTSPFNITFSYWRPVNSHPQSLLYLYETSGQGPLSNYYKPPTFISGNGCAFLAGTTYYNRAQLPLLKYDGQFLSYAGLPVPTCTASIGAATGLTGTFKYKAFWRRIDAQGNIIEGTPSEASSVTLANEKGTVTYRNLAYGQDTAGYIANCAVMKNGGNLSYTSGTSIKISTNAATNVMPTLRVGDPLFFKDSTGALHRSWVTGIDGSPVTTNPATMKIADTGTFTIVDDESFSAGLSLVILRTTDGGNTYYVLTEIANDAFTTGNITYTDTLADATLIGYERFIEAEIGQEHDAPPACSLLTEHQGGLVVSGNRTTPNSIYFSIPGDLEYFPTASNQFDVPGGESGPITAIASDTYDHLAVFKERSYYDVTGDLAGGIFAVQVRTQGDYGIPSQGSIARVRGVLIGLSKLGFVIISNGEILTQVFRKLNARIIGQSWDPQYAIAANDPFTRSYICNIPHGPERTTASSTFVLDYAREDITPLEREYGTYLAPNASLAAYGDTLYWLTLEENLTNSSGGAVYRRLDRFVNSVAPRLDTHSFADHTTAINYVLEGGAINFGEPSLSKTMERIRTYSIPNDYIIEHWVPFTATLDTTIFPDASFFGSAYAGGFTTTLTFSTVNDWYKDVKVAPVKAFLYMVRYTTNVIFEAPFYSGYEIVFSLPYEKEDIIK